MVTSPAAIPADSRLELLLFTLDKRGSDMVRTGASYSKRPPHSSHLVSIYDSDQMVSSEGKAK